MKTNQVLSLCTFVLAALMLSVGCGRGTPEERHPGPAVVKVSEPLTTRPKDSTKLRAALAGSVHATLDCSDCHAPTEGSKPGKAHCAGSCHEEETQAYQESVHGTAHAHGNARTATCDSCHGSHDVLPVVDSRSRVSPGNTPLTCGQCHANPELAARLGIKAPDAGRRYLESIHGQALVAQGLVVAPSCADCHGQAHQIFKAKDPRSSVNHFNIANTCGRCHAGPSQKYMAGIHGQALQAEAAKKGIQLPIAGAVQEKSSKTAAAEAKSELEAGAAEVAAGSKAPTCSTCHTAHSIVMPGARFQLASDKICGGCHADRLKRYMDTYHGRAHDLGDAAVAACHDCHGQHDILPSSNPASRLSQQNRLATCRKCHTGAPANFAGYLTHANHSDVQHYPKLYWTYIAMTALLLSTFGFFGIHTILWLVRTLIVRFRDPKAFREAKQRIRQEKGVRLYRRFRPVDRFVHFLVIVSFLLLVATGMPLKFHTAPWAHAIFRAVGGASVAASIHRFAAIVTFMYFGLHVASLFALLGKHRGQVVDEKGHIVWRRVARVAFGPDSPFPRWQDVKDVGSHLKWFVGLGPKPKFDRFTYWEKFDYMAVFWGVTVIGLSGLVMWFPTFVTRFLPGWMINVAHIIHSDEALLAAGFIFTFHFFNSHFRPEKFPFDAVMFSGRVSEEELRHERPAQYERMKQDGSIEETASPGEWPEWKVIVNPFGVAAIIIGQLLAAAIFYALLT